MSTDLNSIAQQIESLLKTEESLVIQGRDDLKLSIERRAKLQELTDELYLEYEDLNKRKSQLKNHPNVEVMDWAEAVLSMSNLAIIVLDTTGLGDHSDIIRIYALDVHGECLVDQIVKPGRENTPNTAWTGISQEELAAAPTIKEAWPNIVKALHGHLSLPTISIS